MKHYLFTKEQIKYNKWFITEIVAIVNIDKFRVQNTNENLLVVDSLLLFI